MIRHSKRIVLGAAALVALALGGATFAQAGPSSQAPTAIKVAPVSAPEAPATSKDTDTIQSGDQKTPDARGTGAKAADVGSSRATDGDSTQSGDQTTPDASGANAEKSAPEQGSGSPEGTGSERANNDGPGGHADSTSAAADQQFNGQQ